MSGDIKKRIKKSLTSQLAVAGCFIMASLVLTVQTVLAAEVPVRVKLAAVQQLVRGNGTEVTSLDPHKVNGVPESNVISELLEGLVNFSITGGIVPGVAVSWHSSDLQHWVFSLRPEAQWSNGEPVTAHDFVYSWRRLADPNTASPYSSYLQYIKIKHIDEIIAGKRAPEELGITALDTHTLQISLSQPVPYLVKMLEHTSLKPVHKATVEKYQDKWTLPEHYVGNGAYRLQQWIIHEQIVLMRNKHYWDNCKTVINQVKYLPIESEVAALARYRSGEIDIISGAVPMEQIQQLQKEHPNELYNTPRLAVYYYDLNVKKPPFNNVKVRKALSLALDRDLVVNKVRNYGEVAAYAFTPNITEGALTKKPEWATWTQQKRDQMARTLLQQAGYTKTKPLKFTLLYNTSEMHRKIAVAASSLWKKTLGAEVALMGKEWKTFLSSREQGDFQMARAGWAADYNEPSAFLNILLSGSSNNQSGYESPLFDGFLAQALAAPNEATRQLYYQQAEAQLDADVPVIPVYYAAEVRMIKPYVGGYSLLNPMHTVYTKDLYIMHH